MLRSDRKRGRRAQETGSVLVELALALPLLVLVLVSTADFARLFYMEMELTNAARAGAQFGAFNAGTSGNFSGMQTTAQKAAPNVTLSAIASRSCQCATNSGTFSAAVSCTSPPCGGSDHFVVSVTVTTTGTFTVISGFLPGIPRTKVLTRTATLRVPL